MTVVNRVIDRKLFPMFRKNKTSELLNLLRPFNNSVLLLAKVDAYSKKFLKESKTMEKLMRERNLNMTIVLSNLNGTGWHWSRLWSGLGGELKPFPTTGLLLLGEAITFCDHVKMFGFYPFNKDHQNRTIPYHYWRDFIAVPSETPHKFVAEWRVKNSGNTAVGTLRPVYVTPVPIFTVQKQNWTKYLMIRKALEGIFSPKVRIVRATTPAGSLKRCLNDVARKKECSAITPIRHYSTCALVGNSGILLNSSCGDEIDSHDFVIRFNLGPLQNYSEDVGRNVNMTVVNRAIVRDTLFPMLKKNKTSELLNLLRPFNNSVLLLVKEDSYSIKFLNECKTVENIMREMDLNLTIALSNLNGTGLNLPRLWSDLSGRKLKPLPTTGLLLLGEAITFCDHVTLFGFYPFNKDRQNRTIPYHYWRDFIAVPSKTPHKFVAEPRVRKSNRTVRTSPPLLVTSVPNFTAQKQNWTKYLNIRNALEGVFSPKVRIVRATTPSGSLKNCLKDVARKKECSAITPIRHYSTCALVGNSGILLNSSCGDEIDSHDFNYSEDVGRNVNMTVVNRAIVRDTLFPKWRKNKTSEVLNLLRPFNNSVLLLAKEDSYSIKFLNECKRMENIMREMDLHLTIALSNLNGTGLNFQRLWSDLSGRKLKPLPTTGLLLLGEAITFCDHVTLFGFYPFNKDRQNYTIPYHYWRDFTSVPSKTPHKFVSEYKLLVELDKEGIITHTVNCKAI
ncbi:hypothetical protein Bbelb_331900 [Branchiostoma belcheri]|nr:hypothetical protein Bbelb_331900 [Branchiostoma belcheri]